MAFTKLHKDIQATLKREGYHTPTPIQEQTIPGALEGRDVIGIAQTGTGKTAAFLLPIIHRITEDRAVAKPKHPLVLILCPTRELAQQVHRSVLTYGKQTGIKSAAIYGGVGYGKQKHALKQGVEFVVATPGRLKDLIEQHVVKLNDVKYFILDEADRMLDMGFKPDIDRIASKLPKKRQTLLFSATSSKAVNDFAKQVLHQPLHVQTSSGQPTAEGITQHLVHVHSDKKLQLLEEELSKGKKTIIFARTKRRVDRLGKRLNKKKLRSITIHGDKSQSYRKKAIQRFKESNSAILIATDVAARGLDIDDVALVINYDLPDDPEQYIHRIGRTGRAEKEGIAISYCSPQERQKYAAVKKLLGDHTPEEEWKYDKRSQHATKKSSKRRPYYKNRHKKRRG